MEHQARAAGVPGVAGGMIAQARDLFPGGPVVVAAQEHPRLATGIKRAVGVAEIDPAVVGEDGLVPGHHGGAVSGANPLEEKEGEVKLWHKSVCTAGGTLKAVFVLRGENCQIRKLGW